MPVKRITTEEIWASWFNCGVSSDTMRFSASQSPYTSSDCIFLCSSLAMQGQHGGTEISNDPGLQVSGTAQPGGLPASVGMSKPSVTSTTLQ